MAYASARIAAIVDKVLKITNEWRQEDVTESDVLSWINDCEAELADAEAFGPKEAALTLVADQSEYDLSTAFNDFASIYGVKFKLEASGKWPNLPEMTNTNLFDSIVAYLDSHDTPLCWNARGKLFRIAPAPATGSSDRVKVRYFYYPTAHDGSADDEPEFPRNELYVAYAIMQVCAMEGFTGTRDNYDRWSANFQIEKRRALGGVYRVTQLRPV